MADPHVLSALFDKYSETLGLLKQLERQAAKHGDALSHIEAVIHLYRPEWTPEGTRPRKPHRPSRWPGRGEGMRTALLILRETQSVLTTREIVVRVLDRLNMPEPDYDELKLICSSLNSALRNKAAKLGVAIALTIATAAIGWGWNYGLTQERAYEQEARQAHANQTENGCYQIACRLRPRLRASGLGR